MSEKKKIISKRTVMIAVCCVLALILVALLAFVIMGKTILGRINRFGDNTPTLSDEEKQSILNETDGSSLGEEVDPNDIFLNHDPVEDIIASENVINFLLVGQDRREGEGRQRSDSMILCTINKTTKTLTMTSFMRDIWLKIPGYYDQRLNIPYMEGGFELLNATLQHNFGVSSDHNIEVDFDGFMDIIETVGGVDIELTQAEAKYLNRRGNWDVGDERDWTLTEGWNHLTGPQALAFSRIRDIGDDFGRTNRQRTVLTALLEKAKKMNLLEAYNLILAITPHITTDMTDREIVAYAKVLLPIISELEIVSQRVPVDSYFSYATIQGNSVILLGNTGSQKAIELLKNTMMEIEPEETETTQTTLNTP